MMIMIGLILLATSTGILLGSANFRVAVLVPALAIVWLAVEVVSATLGLGDRGYLSTAVLATVGLQAGYFAALLERSLRRSATVRPKSTAFSSRFT